MTDNMSDFSNEYVLICFPLKISLHLFPMSSETVEHRPGPWKVLGRQYPFFLLFKNHNVETAELHGNW